MIERYLRVIIFTQNIVRELQVFRSDKRVIKGSYLHLNIVEELQELISLLITFD